MLLHHVAAHWHGRGRAAACLGTPTLTIAAGRAVFSAADGAGNVARRIWTAGAALRGGALAAAFLPMGVGQPCRCLAMLSAAVALRKGHARRATRAAARRIVLSRGAAGTAPQAVADVLEQRLSPAEAETTEAPVVGTYEVIRSEPSPERHFVDVASLGSPDGPAMGEKVWIRARVATVRVKGKTSFIVLRQHSLHTVQAVKFKSKEDGGESATAFAKFFKSIPLESLVDVLGTVVEATVNGCTQSDVELQMERAYCISAASSTLPFLLADAQRSEAEIEESLKTDRPYVRVLPDLRLDHRWLDVRVPANNAILRVKAAVCKLFREALTERGFIEIHTPKLIAGESEGGAEVFRTEYFGRQASLAQSPQLYKQMALSADLPGVFEVGPVFRAENSNTNRHLCEFTGLDLEMPIAWHYNEVIAVVHETLARVCSGVEAECAELLATIRKMYPSEAPLIPEGGPCVVHWPEAMRMLAEAGVEREQLADLSTEEEKLLGKLVREGRGSDLFFLDRYPSSVRPFYTMPCSAQPEYSNSYDVILRGQEIGSGAQRCHDPELLEARCAELGVPTGPLEPYINSFRHGVPPHGGVGLGLERIVQLYLGLDNIRKATFFTRDPMRLSP
mmetsp:Transcript_13360/g.36888  ORF Transcript_13360/g.36888 Transcript_13360/m.36888 type:complete len:620 (-) Transcript_13360:157-2016(-)